ncbi:MAG: hypothetical protein IPN47_23785 [Gemmatimonadetes bacterium]|nr:hypothetical protein [Gemmatimonadota bacterium]
MKPLTTLEAKQQQLRHSDTYRRAHIIYLDDMHRDWAAVELNRVPLRACADTIVISERRALAAHRAAVAESLAGGGLSEGHEPPWSEMTGRHFEFHNYEHLKIATGFELHLKARYRPRATFFTALPSAAVDAQR